MLRLIARAAIAAGIVAGATAAVSAPALAQPADLQAKADAYVERTWPADGPGAAIIITQRGRTIYARGRGLADIEARTPITPDTVFRMASITKQFTAGVIMQLVQEGRIGLDDPVSRFFPDYPQPGATATVRQLLNHTSGIQSYTANPGFMTNPANMNRAYTTAEMMALSSAVPSRSQPGQAWAYNNSGYVLLGAIIERVTGKAWHEAVNERIARPLGLTTIRYGVGEENIAGMARGYTRIGDATAPARGMHMSVPHAAGALVGTVRDLAGWAQALHHGRVVNAETYAQMIRPAVLADGQTQPYGAGLGLDSVIGRRAIGHNGGIFGFGTTSTYFPEEDLFVAIFSNSDTHVVSPDAALRRLAGIALGVPFPDLNVTPVDMAAVEPFFGLYRAESDGVERAFFARDGKLYTRRGDAPELEVFAAGGNRFFYGPASLTWFETVRGPDGTAALAIYREGNPIAERSARIGPVPTGPVTPTSVAMPRAVLARYVGTYRMPIGPLTVAFGQGDTLTVQLEGQPPLATAATSEVDFTVVGAGATVHFQPDGRRITVRQQGREMSGDRVEP